MPDTESEKNPALDPRNSTPLPIVLDGSAKFARLQCVEEITHRIAGVWRQLVAGRRCSERVDAIAQLILVERGAAHSAPAVFRAARTASLFESFIGTSGSRRTFFILPSIASAALTGNGFDSTKAARIQGRSFMCSSRA